MSCKITEFGLGLPRLHRTQAFVEMVVSGGPQNDEERTYFHSQEGDVGRWSWGE